MRQSRTKDEILHFGRLLRCLRDKAGFSRAKLARRAKLSEATLKLLEAGDHFPEPPILYRLMSVRELRLLPDVVWDRYGLRIIDEIEPEMRAEETDTHTRVIVTLTIAFRKQQNEPQ